MSHKWSGNVHELKVAVQDAVSRSLANRILADDFDLGCPMNEPAVHDAGALREDEYMNLRIRHILNHAKGLNDAVREFGKSKNTLYAWMDRLGIENPFKAVKG